MRNGLGSKYLATYCKNAVEIAENVFLEWSQRPNGEIDLQEAVSDLVASINVSVFSLSFVHVRLFIGGCRYATLWVRRVIESTGRSSRSACWI